MIDLARIRQPLVLFSILACGAFFITVWSASKSDWGNKNLHVQQAEAFLAGRIDLPEERHDVAIHAGRYYVPFPPMPAVVLVPFRVVPGGVDTMLVSLLLLLISALVAWDLLKTLNVDATSRGWLLLAFFLGTGYWLAVVRCHYAWYFAHLVCVTFVLLAIREALGKGRGIIAGLFLGLAFLSRQLAIYSAILVAAALLANRRHGATRARGLAVLGFLFAMGAAVGVYLAFNHVRFGSPFDTGYAYIQLEGILKERVDRHGLFSATYVPFNAIYMFLQGPHITFRDGLTPWDMDPFGTSITFASPFVFAALFARGRRRLRVCAWIAIGLCVTHMMFYYNNGWAQRNAQRFALDFMPVMLVLLALYVAPRREHLAPFRLAVIYSVLLNVVALLVIPTAKGLSH